MPQSTTNTRMECNDGISYAGRGIVTEACLSWSRMKEKPAIPRFLHEFVWTFGSSGSLLVGLEGLQEWMRFLKKRFSSGRLIQKAPKPSSKKKAAPNKNAKMYETSLKLEFNSPKKTFNLQNPKLNNHDNHRRFWRNSCFCNSLCGGHGLRR